VPRAGAARPVVGLVADSVHVVIAAHRVDRPRIGQDLRVGDRRVVRRCVVGDGIAGNAVLEPAPGDDDQNEEPSHGPRIR
jgi:hypothetical protein